MMLAAKLGQRCLDSLIACTYFTPLTAVSAFLAAAGFELDLKFVHTYSTHHSYICSWEGRIFSIDFHFIR